MLGRLDRVRQTFCYSSVSTKLRTWHVCLELRVCLSQALFSPRCVMYLVLNHTYRVSFSVQKHHREMPAVLMPTEWHVNGGLLQLPCFQGCCSADRRIFCALLSCCDTAWFLSKVRKNSCFQGVSQQAAFAWGLGAAAVTTAQ